MGLAKPVLLRRLRNDLQDVSNMPGVTVSDLDEALELPYTLHVVLDGIEGYSAPGRVIEHHEFDLILGEDFPYERPRLKWVTEIFHPNILAPSEGGGVCVADRDHWDFDSRLSDFIDAVTDLVKNPNPYNPLVSETCSAAAEWFLKQA